MASHSDVFVEEIQFQEILPIWKQFLWPNRRSLIEPTSAMAFPSGYDMSLLKSKGYYWSASIQGKRVGVNSGFQTSETHFRSRGLFVFPQARRRGVAQCLFQALEQKALLLGCECLWSLPRATSLRAYEKFGFQKEHPAENSSVEFGPNFYATKQIK